MWQAHRIHMHVFYIYIYIYIYIWKRKCRDAYQIQGVSLILNINLEAINVFFVVVFFYHLGQSGIYFMK